MLQGMNLYVKAIKIKWNIHLLAENVCLVKNKLYLGILRLQNIVEFSYEMLYFQIKLLNASY